MTIDESGLIRWQPVASQFGPNSVNVLVEDGRGGAATQQFSIAVINQTSNQPPSIVSRPSLSARAGLGYRYDARATDPDGDPVIWSLDSAPAGMSLDSRLGSLRWAATLDQLGNQPVVLRATDAQGGFTRQFFTITVRAINTPPNIVSIPVTQAALGRLYSYAVQAVDPDGDPLTYSLVSAPDGMSIDSGTGLVQWAPGAGQLGNQKVIVNVTDNSSGGVLQVYTVVVFATGANQPPLFTSTPPFVATVGQPYSYVAIATDPEGDALHFSLTNAPSGLTIDNASGALQWSPVPAQLGANSVLVVVTDSAGNIATQHFVITVKSVDRPPTIDSTPGTTVTVGGDYGYDVAVSDPDGDPISFALVIAPPGMTVDPLGRITWSPLAGDIGSQSVLVTANDGRGGIASEAFSVTVTADLEAPRANLLLNENSVDVGSSVTVLASATDAVGVASLVLTENGVAIALDGSGRAIIIANTAGSFTFIARATDAAGNVGTATQTLVVIDPHDVTAPFVQMITPSDNDVVTNSTNVIGTVTDADLLFYTLSAAPVGSDEFTEFSRGTTPVTDGVLGQFDPTMLTDDSYVIRLTAVDAGGNSSVDEHVVNVAGELKLGQFTLSFADMTIPVAGIPITVTRTYNSLNASRLEDFGYGWQLEFRNVDLRTSVVPTGMEDEGAYSPFQVGSHVYVTIPGGKREGFTFQPTLAAGLAGSFLGIFDPVLVPDDGVTSSLTVDPAALTIGGDGSVFGFGTGEAYNPASPDFGGSYLLTTKDGLAYTIDAETGKLTAASDANNNTLEFSDAGVISSNGTSIIFERDPRGRIAAIVDPMGNSVHYSYSATDDLVAVTDRTNETTKFVYLSSPAHYLDQVIDPLGRTGVRTEYDAQGRLVKVIDAAGNPVQIVYDPTDSLETITDQDGNTVTDEYDARGNIVSQTDALGNITTQTFDANNNMLTHTDPLGRMTSYTYDSRGDALTQNDPLGNTTISTFQAFTFGTTVLAVTHGQAAAPFTAISSASDALGNTTSYGYDFVGNLTSFTDPEGKTNAISYEPSGKPTSLADADGNTTHYHYDAADQIQLQIDALGNVTAYTYDANGDPLTVTTSRTNADGAARTLTTQTEYDARGRVIAVTDPNGGVSRTEYDAAGNVTATIDPLSHRTTYVYNDRNELIETVYPDATPNDQSDNPRTQEEYDAVGNKTASIDEAGRRTEYQYDALGQLVKTTYPDGTATKTEYDADDESTALIDELDNRTEYSYDADGNLTMQHDALDNETTSAYDANGRKTADTDALGHTTLYIFDARGFLVETHYADGSKTTATLDDNGQVIARTDQLNRTTKFEYDAGGRLIAVVDALAQRTAYAYDEASDLISTVGANGELTTYEYTNLGEQTAVSLPALPGQAPFRSTAQYDTDGNVVATTDFNGNTITYSYDARNRLISKAYPDGTSVAYTFTLTGQEATVTDARGTTAYSYDARDRLASRTDPDGTVISYLYDANGNRTNVATPAGSTSYTFDALGRETTVTDQDGAVTRYTYDAAGNLIRTKLPNGTEETRAYDVLNRLTFLQDTNGGNVIASYAYTVGLTGLRDTVIENTGRRVDYTYDALDRLSEENIIDAVFGNRTLDYTYDPVGNRLTLTDSIDGVTTYTFDAMNRLATETLSGQVTRYTYDRNGNTLSKISPTDAVFYAWDFDNRLITADTNGDGLVDERNVYDARGDLMAQTINGQETRYLVDANQAFPQVVMEYRPNGDVVVSYQYGISLISQNRGGVKSFYAVDGLGSTRELTNDLGVVTDTVIYDAFGRILAQTGTTMNSYLFTAQRQDSTTGLDYLRARFLNSATGTFVSADSFAGEARNPLTLNKYVYTTQNPVNFVDPSGHIGELADVNVSEAVSGYVQAAVDLVDNVVRYEKLVSEARAISDLFFLISLGIAARSILSGGIPKAGVTIRERDYSRVGLILKIELRFYFDPSGKGSYVLGIPIPADLLLTVAVDIQKNPKFRATLDLSNLSKSSIEGGFNINIGEVKSFGLELLKLDFALRQAFSGPVGLNGPVAAFKIGLDASLVGGAFKLSVPLKKYPEDDDIGAGLGVL